MNNSNISVNQEEVSITTDGEFPFDLDTFLIVSKFVSCCVGIPVNLSVVVAITRHGQLRNRPRNIFLLGIIFSYLTFFVPTIIELIGWESVPFESVCQANVAVIGLTHALLLLNMSLALIDRYVAINHPEWYREKMTASLASALVILGSALIALLIQFVYILGLGPAPTCQMWNVHTKTLTVVLVILFSICSALNVIVYRQAPKCSSQTMNNYSANNQTAITAEGEGIEWVEFDDFTNELGNQTTLSAVDDELSPSIRSVPSIHLNVNSDDLMSQTEVKDTRTLIIGVTSFVAAAYLGVAFVSAFFACRLFIGELQCGNLTWAWRYVRELSLIPVFYSSMILLMGNDELRKTCWACKN